MLISRRALLCAAVAATALGAVAVPALGGTTTQKATTNVTVGDDFYACGKCTGTLPLNLTVAKNSSVKWVWGNDNTDTHNVKLTATHPKGVKPKDFTSGDYANGAVFKRKFTTPGKYAFICSYHKNLMQITVNVKK